MTPSHDLEKRIAKLEALLNLPSGERRTEQSLLPLWTMPLALIAMGVATKALGSPNHAYQIILGGLFTAVAYHQGWWKLPQRTWEKPLFLVNAYLLATLLKLFIGSGIRRPLFWIQIPKFSNWSLDWQPTLLAEWAVDLTVLQTFFLLALLFGLIARLEFLASSLLLALFVVSIPSWTAIEWPLVFPALLLTSATIYFQVFPKRQK